MNKTIILMSTTKNFRSFTMRLQKISNLPKSPPKSPSLRSQSMTDTDDEEYNEEEDFLRKINIAVTKCRNTRQIIATVQPEFRMTALKIHTEAKRSIRSATPQNIDNIISELDLLETLLEYDKKIN